MIDFKRAEEEFQRYVANFDLENTKITAKIKHTMGVVRATKYISKKIGLLEEDIRLAKLIALLHDIGRFKQIEEHNSFVDYETFNHAEVGVIILFEEKLIEKFVDNRKYDNIILKAITNHNRLSIQKELRKKELLHTKLIRDADKVDIFRVIIEEDMNDIINLTSRELEGSDITDFIFNSFMNNNTIVSKDLVTPLDYWVFYLAFVFDFNFIPSLKYIKKENYINKIVGRFDYKLPNTKKKMEKVQSHAEQYINERIKNGK